MAQDEFKFDTPKVKCTQERLAIHDSLDILGGKWKLQILTYLANRPEKQNHFSQIKSDIEGISAKMLSKELRNLEENLLVSRTQDETLSSSFTYSITEYGKNVLPLTDTLIHWGLTHREKIKQTLR